MSEEREFEIEEGAETEAHLKRSSRANEEERDELDSEDEDVELHAKQPPTAL